MADPKIRYDIQATATGGADVNALAASLEKLDAAVDPQVAARARAVADELRKLGAQQDAIDRFRALKTATEDAAKALEQAQAQAQALAREIAASDAPTKAQAGQMQKLADAVKSAKAELQGQQQALDGARAGLAAVGLSAGTLATSQTQVRTALQGARTEAQQLGATYTTLGQQQATAANDLKALAAATDTARQRMLATDAAFEQYRGTLGDLGKAEKDEIARLDQLAERARLARVAYGDQASAYAAAGGSLDSLKGKYAGVATASGTASAAASRVGTAGREAAAGLDATGQAASAASSKLQGTVESLRNLTALDVASRLGSQFTQLVGDVGATAEQMQNLEARVKLATGAGEAFQKGWAGIREVALATNSSLQETGELYARIVQSGKEFGLSQEAALQLTKTINEATQISGGSAQANAAAITQLNQALQSGVLRGEEFNSIMEQAPRLARALADGLGVTTGQLRALSQEGQLTTQAVVQALQSQRAVLDKEFGTLPQTVGRALENLRTQWALLVSDFTKGAGQVSVVAQGINALAANLTTVAEVAGRAGAVLTAAIAVQAVGALRALATQAAASAGSVGLLNAQLSALPKVLNIAVAFTGLEAGYQFGKFLYENSETARRLGVTVVEFFTELVSELQFLKEAAAAIFTDDTVSAAIDRYNQRLEQQQQIFRGLYEDAQKSPEQIRLAAESAAQQAALVGDAATAAGTQVQGAGAAGAGALAGLGAAAGAAGTQMAAAGSTGAAGIGKATSAATAARDAVAGLGAALTAATPAFQASAQQQADAMAKVALASTKAADTFRQDLPAALDKLSGQQLEQFRTLVTRAFGDARTEAERLAATLKDGSAAQAEALGRAARSAELLQLALLEVGKQAAQSLGVDLDGASRNLSASLVQAQDNLALLLRTLPQLRAAGVDTGAAVGEALGKMLDGAKNAADVQAIEARLRSMGEQGVLSGEQVAAGLRAAAEKAVDLKAKLEDAIPGIQSLGEAARKAGVDVALLTGGLTKEGRDAIQQIADLTSQIVKAGVSAERASPLLADALGKRVQAAQTREEVDRLRQEIDRATAAGKLFGADAAAALEAVKRKAEELSPAYRQAAADARALGVELQGATRVNPEDGIRAFERLKASGKASADEITQAFINLANRQIQAAQGVVPEWVKVEAQFRGAVITVDEAGRAVVKTLADATKGAQDLANQLPEVGAAARKALGDVQDLAAGFGLLEQKALDARNASVASGKAKRSLGELIQNTASGGITREVSSGQAANKPATGNWTYVLSGFLIPGVDAQGRPVPGGWREVDGTQTLGGAPRPAPPPAPVPTPAPRPAGSSTTPPPASGSPAAPAAAPPAQYFVTNVTIGGGEVRSITTTDAASQQALLDALEAARLAGGGP